MDAKTISIDWATVLPVMIATLAPTLTGFLQQFSKKWIEQAPWWAKGLISSAVAAIIAMIGSYAADGDALMATAGGALVGAIGALNIALRKGSRGNLEVIVQQKPAEIK